MVRGREDYIVSELGNWNVAEKFVYEKIMKPLKKCDRYEDIAYFGYESLIEELINYQAPPNDVIKIKAMERLVKELIRIIENSKFAMKVGNTRKTALEYRGKLKKILPIIPTLLRKKANQINKTSSYIIKNPKLFDSILDTISEIKSRINEPLNQNHLIFTDREEFDVKKFKSNIKRRITTQG